MSPLWMISLIAAAIAAAALIFKIGRWVESVDSDRKMFREFMKDLHDDIKGMREDIKGMREDIKGMREDIKDVREGLTQVHKGLMEVHEDVKKIFSHLISAPTSQSSPRRLSELGEKMSRQIEARTWAQAKATEFAAQMRGRQPYEIHEFCFRYVKGEFRPDAEWDAKIGACAYESGLERDGVLDVLAIELRDALLGLEGGGTALHRENSGP